MKADSGVTLSRGPSAAARDVERHRYKVADLEILDVTAFLDHLAGDAGRCRRAAPDHMLIGAADVGGDNFENYAVINLFPGWILHLREIDGLNFDLVRSEKHYSGIFCHGTISTFPPGIV